MVKRSVKIRPARVSYPRFYCCGGCGEFHPFGWTGDCREDSQRFTANTLDDSYPTWIEVNEETGRPEE